ncbi:TPA: hypothetical protein KEU07_004169 [Serratia marcescens]|nr:hypothetical protein [Serratia marcescens]
MIDKYLLEDLSLRSDEKGELARWVIQLQADVDTERRKSASLESVIYARDTRIAELEAIRSDASQVFKEIGNELGCNPDNESIMMAIDELKKRLATPVRLSCETHPRCRTQHAKDVRAAGFTVTVERDEEPCHEKA